MLDLVLPNGRTMSDMAKARQDRSKIVGLSPWRDQAVNGRGVKGAASKKARWRDCYDMYRQHSIVRAAIEKIAKSATNVGYSFVPRDTRSPTNAQEVATLKRFFDGQDNFIAELRKIYKDLLIYGDAYLYIVSDKRRRPVKLKRLNPKTIHIKVKRNGDVVNYFQKDMDDMGDDVVMYEPQEILHFKLDDPDNDIYGLSPLESLKWAVAADLYAQRYNASFFENSGVTGTIIGVKNADPDEVQRNRMWFEQHYTGPQNAHKPVIVEGEAITVQKSVATHTEMGFLQGREFIMMEILAVLDVPPAKLGIMESANRSNSKEQDKSFRVESIDPLQGLVESVINDEFVRKILGVKNTIFVHSEGDTRDAIEQMDYYTKGQAWGIYTSNEVRDKLGMAPLDGGDTAGIMTPTGFVPLDRLQLYFAMPQQNTDKIPVGSDPPEGEPAPQPVGARTASVATPIATKAYEMDTGTLLTAALTKLSMAKTNRSALTQAYAYLNDAAHMNDTRVDNALMSLQKAVRSDDPFLTEGYIDRAMEALSVFIAPLVDSQTILDSVIPKEGADE